MRRFAPFLVACALAFSTAAAAHPNGRVVRVERTGPDPALLFLGTVLGGLTGACIGSAYIYAIADGHDGMTMAAPFPGVTMSTHSWAGSAAILGMTAGGLTGFTLAALLSPTEEIEYVRR